MTSTATESIQTRTAQQRRDAPEAAEPARPDEGVRAAGPVLRPRSEGPLLRRRRAPRALLAMLPTLALLVLFIAVWEAVVRMLHVPTYLVAAPSAVVERLLRDPGFFVVEGGVSLGEALGGLAVGGGLAFLAGMLMARVPWLERGLLPLAIVLKMTPVVVLAPLFVLWFGFGPAPRVLSAALLTFFPVLIGVVTGLRAPPAAARDVLATLDASAVDEMRLLQLPAAMPHLFAAVKVSATLALLGAVIAEWVGGDRGLGRAILLANSNLDTVTTLAGVVTLALIGIGLVGVITFLERRTIFWQ